MGRSRVAKTERAPRFEGFKPSSAKASEIKKRVGRKDTKAEVTLREALWAAGYRYRKNVASLPGKPDIVLVKQRIAIFVDGDFWHGRNWEERKAKLQKGANAPYWVAKIEANMRRDVRNAGTLTAMGWCVFRFWERDVNHSVVGSIAAIAESTRPAALRSGAQTPASRRSCTHAPRRRTALRFRDRPRECSCARPAR